MGNQKQLLNLLHLEPLTKKNVPRESNVPKNTAPHSPPDDIWQLQIDTLNVLEGRKDINDFDDNYQKKIKSHYQFSATNHLSNTEIIAKRNRNTIDLV